MDDSCVARLDQHGSGLSGNGRKLQDAADPVVLAGFRYICGFLNALLVKLLWWLVAGRYQMPVENPARSAPPATTGIHPVKPRSGPSRTSY
jgi:hypothetical protein